MDEKTSSGMQALRETFTKQSKKYQQVLDEQLSKAKNNASQIGKISLIVGASVVGIYLLSKAISGKEKKKSTKKGEDIKSENIPVVYGEKKTNRFLEVFWESISVFLLAIAKQKLLEFLESKINDDKKSDTTTTHTK